MAKSKSCSRWKDAKDPIRGRVQIMTCGDAATKIPTLCVVYKEGKVYKGYCSLNGGKGMYTGYKGSTPDAVKRQIEKDVP